VSAPFQSFGKIPRLAKVNMVVTEKIDGTNACVVITEDGEVSAQSRTRVIVPGDDNFGFAAWVQENATELRALGPGYHFGEWYGRGIQRSYHMQDRRFALFNVQRWGEQRPECCEVVPLLYHGPLSTEELDYHLDVLAISGSRIDPGTPAEGVMIYLTAIGTYIKHPFDPRPKGATQ